MKALSRILLLGVLLTGLISCADQIVSECDTGEILTTKGKRLSFADIQAQVFTPNCAKAGCHLGPTPAQGMDLSEGNAYDNIVNVLSSEAAPLKRVDPGNSADSYLIIKLEGTDNRLKGGRMPLDGNFLQQSVIDSIKGWIDRGAPRED